VGGGEGTRGPPGLWFSALLGCLTQHVDQLIDARQATKVKYRLSDCYLSAFAMFYLQDPSLLEFQRRFQDTIQNNNLRTVFGVQSIPVDSQLRQIIDSHDHAPLSATFLPLFQRLREAGVLAAFQFMPQLFLLTLDGSQYFGSSRLQCPRCLLKEHKDGRREYSHQILQATVVHPELRQVIPLAPEFIANEDGTQKQDCEINAAKRLIARIRTDHPQPPFIIVGDGLYSKQPFVALLGQGAQPLHFILVAKPADHKDLFANIEGLRRGKLISRREIVDEKGRHHVYEWVSEMPLNSSPNSPTVNFLQYWLINKDGKVGYHNSWITDLLLDEHTVQWVTRGGRARWKIENESFNTLKNQGYHLEHNFGHGREFLSEALFLLNLLAFFFHQIFELVDGLYQQARARFSARREFWNAVRNAFRLFLFVDWDQVLHRINSPPLPAFP
jgi:hypothetical protein